MFIIKEDYLHVVYLVSLCCPLFLVIFEDHKHALTFSRKFPLLFIAHSLSVTISVPVRFSEEVIPQEEEEAPMSELSKPSSHWNSHSACVTYNKLNAKVAYPFSQQFQSVNELLLHCQ